MSGLNSKNNFTFSSALSGRGWNKAVASKTFFAGVNCGCLGSNSSGSTLNYHR